MEENGKKHRIEYIPAAPGVVLSEMAKYRLTSLVPLGRLTTDTAIRYYLSKIFDVSWVDFERDYIAFMPVLLNEQAYAQLNLHRVVSDSGIVDWVHKDKLRDEGFELIPSNRSKGRLIVKDYKMYFFDFEKECSLTVEDFRKYKLERVIP